MATVNKNFRIKDGLIVEGTTGIINGSDIITEDKIVGGSQTNIAVTYNATTGMVDFAAENGVADSTTDDLAEGTAHLYFTDQRAIDAVGGSATPANSPNTVVKRDENGNFEAGNVSVTQLTVQTAGTIFEDSGFNIGSNTGNDLNLYGNVGVNITANNADIILNADGASYLTSATSGNEIATHGYADTVAGTAETNAKGYADGLAGNYDAAGAAGIVAGDLSTHISDTSTHGVAGDIVGTTDAQTLTNKIINDELYFTNPSTAPNDGGIKINDVSEDMEITAYTANLHLKGQTDVTVTAVNGDIVLNPDGAAYITSVSAGNQIATNSYVDNAVSGLAWKQAVNLLSMGNLDLASSLTGVAVDGHPAFDGTDGGYRILLTGQTNPTENGIYVLAWDGVDITAARSEDADTVVELIGAAVFVMEGSTYGGTSWVQGNHYANSFDDLVWTQFSGGGTVTAGTGIAVNGLEIAVDRTTVDTWYDEAGAATTAENNAKTYADDTFVTLDSLPGQLDNYILVSEKGQALGVATLDESGYVPVGQLGNVPANYITSVGTNLSVTDGELDLGQYVALQGSDLDGTSLRIGGGTVGDFHQVSKTTALKANVTAGTPHGFAIDGQTVKLLISAKSGTNVHASEALVVVDSFSENAYITEYGSVVSNSDLFSIDSVTFGSTNEVLISSLSGQIQVQVIVTAILEN